MSRNGLKRKSWGLLQNRLTWDYAFLSVPAAFSIRLCYGEGLPPG